ncbi:ABC transporter permease [Lysinibacillus xylanilyticus]|uniref:ABC transporter permease n=1 Tax=Lysinibacillus xylanilyticus TaxID=582475 RepID=UPI003CFEE14B
MKEIIIGDSIKFKRSKLILITILFPLFVFLMNFTDFYFRFDFNKEMAQELHTSDWVFLIISSHWAMFIMVPLSITIFASKIVNIEHEANAWKILFSLPISRYSIYLSKFIYLLVLCAFSATCIVGSILFVGLFLDFNGPIPWGLILKQAFYPYIVSFPLMAFQLWISMVCQNQMISISLGVIFTLSGFFLQNIKWLFWVYPIWGTPILPSDEFNEVISNNDLSFLFIMSFIVGTIFLISGMVHFSKKDMS